MRMGYTIVILVILFPLVMCASITSYEHVFPLQFIEKNTYVSIDEDKSITDPLDMIKAYAGFNAGTSPVELYANLRTTVLWDSDSVIQGNYLTFRIVTDIVSADEPSIYTNYGIAAGVGTEFRSFGPLGGPWLSGPGYGMDFNINIESDDPPPPMPAGEASGDDVIDFLSLVPEIGGSGSKFIISDKGDTIPLVPGKEGSTGSDVMGLFDILSLRFSAGLKIENPDIILRSSPDYIIFHANETQWDYALGDTFFYTVFVDSFIPTNTMAHITVSDPKYFVDLYRRIGLCLQSFGFTVASSYWLDNDKYEFMGVRALEIPYQIPYEDRRFTIPVKVIGQPIVNPDMMTTRTYIFAMDAFGNATEFPEANVSTELRIIIFNGGSSASDTTTMKIAWEDSVHYITIPPIASGYSYDKGVYITFTEPGNHLLNIIQNYDNACDELNTENNNYSRMVKVSSQSKEICVIMRGKEYKPILCEHIPVHTFKSSLGIDTFSVYSDSVFYGYMPSGEDILMSFSPDSSFNDYYYTSRTLNTDTVPLSGYLKNIDMNIMGAVRCSIYDPVGDPIDSAHIEIGAYTAESDSGIAEIFSMAPLPLTYVYSMKISHPLFMDIDTVISVLSGDTSDISLHMISIDSVAPAGSFVFTDNVTFSLSRPVTGTGDQIGMRFTATDDYAGMKCIEIMNKKEGIWYRHDFINQGEDTVIHITHTPDQPPINSWAYFSYRFTDLGGNTSELYQDSLIVCANGPVGSLDALSDTVISPNVKVSLLAQDSLSDVFKMYAGIRGISSAEMLYDTAICVINLPASSGVYELFSVFENTLGVRGDTVLDTVNYIDVGDIIINNGDEYTSSDSVGINIYPRAVSVSINDLSSYIDRGGYPSIQTFIPNCERILGLSIFYTGIDSNITMALFTDSTDGTYDHIPGHELSSCTVYSDSSSGWYYGILDSSVSVFPDSIYQIVLYMHSLDNSLVPFTAAAVDDSRYPPGTYYYAPTTGMWIAGNMDLAFKIFTQQDSFLVSNFSNFSVYSHYTAETSIQWQLNSDSGLNTVYSEAFYNGISPGIIYDGIIVDMASPVIDSILFSPDQTYITEPFCSLSIFFSDNCSEYISVDINNGELLLGFIHSGEKFRYNLPDSIEGSRILSVKVTDFMGNFSVIDTVLDYDPHGIPLTACFNNSDNLYIASRYPTINIDCIKSMNAEYMRYSEDIFDMGIWVPFASSSQCTLADNSSTYHIMRLEVKDNYKQIRTVSLSAFIDSTPPLISDSISDNGIFTESDSVEFHWDMVPDDNESGLSDLILFLYDETIMQNADTAILCPYINSYIFSDSLHKYHSYLGILYSVNNAGTASSPVQSNGIIMNYSPYTPSTVSPIGGDSSGTRPVFRIYGYDGDLDTTLSYHIEVSDDIAFSNILRTFNGHIDTDGWNRERYYPGDTAVFIVSSSDSLPINSMYYWRVSAYDSLTVSSMSSPDSFYISYCSGIMPDFSILSDNASFGIYISNTIQISKDNIRFKLIVPAESDIGLYIYDAIGNRVKSLIDSRLCPGGYFINWNLTDNFMNKLPSGAYFLHMYKDNTLMETKKISILH